MGTKTAQSARLEARIPAKQKAILQRAARLRGQTLTDFILSATTAKAREVIREHEIIELSQADQIVFAEALMRPPKANNKLRRAASSYKRKTTQ